MTIEQIFTDVLLELERARRLHPAWPTDIIHAVGLMMEEAGEAQKEANNYALASLRKEIIETMTTCVRLLIETPCMAQVFPGKPASAGSASTGSANGGGQ